MDGLLVVNALFHGLAALDAELAADRLAVWARCESPSSDADAVNRMQDLLLSEVAGEPAIAVERVPGRDGIGDTVLLRAGPQMTSGATLMIGHLDTVHPLGTINEGLPVRREGDLLYGPGVYDMKGGVLCGLLALVEASRAGLSHPVTFLLSPDEEIGSPTTRDLIEDLARRADRALVMEPARVGGAVVTARKGVAWYDVEVRGVPAHAGTHHADGRSAIRAACELIPMLEAMTDYGVGTTVSTGEIRGGTTRNVVPAECHFTVDVRVTESAQAREIEAAFAALASSRPGFSVSVTGGFNRPPYEKTEATAALLESARAAAWTLGMTLNDVPMVGGGSDGNFTAAVGVPTLDGLGVLGAGAHTLDEHCLVSSLRPRADLIQALLTRSMPRKIAWR